MELKNLKKEKFVTLTLTTIGSEDFDYLKAGKPGQREVYFINKIKEIRIETTSRLFLLLGQFIFEFEGNPHKTLLMKPRDINKIYFPKDTRVSAYSLLTEEEKVETTCRLKLLKQKLPNFINKINFLIEKIK